MSNPTVHQFKITLMDSRPKIWRRLQVPSDYNFQQFHEAIQDAMGWKGLFLLYHINLVNKFLNVSITFYKLPDVLYSFGIFITT